MEYRTNHDRAELSALGINGGLMRKFDPAQPCVNAMDVENVAKAVDTVLPGAGHRVAGPTTGY
jgi:hypothetical protein